MSTLRDSTELAPDAGSGLRFGLVVSRYHDDITEALLQGAEQLLRQHGAEVSP